MSEPSLSERQLSYCLSHAREICGSLSSLKRWHWGLPEGISPSHFSLWLSGSLQVVIWFQLLKLKLPPMGWECGGVCYCKRTPPHPFQGHIPVPKLMRKKRQMCPPHSGNCSNSWGWLSLKGKIAKSHTLGCVHLDMKGLIPSLGYSWLQQTHKQSRSHLRYTPALQGTGSPGRLSRDWRNYY